ncbi:GNAT family N-acetyltransferase [Thalassobacter stenotrophicus]|uniref:Predicted N-acetyltransferase YhbS n=2 Tax=Thalassobacter stenotrophicus TaxID=266809 RepID=A0ABY1HZJ6_9RHOB|nr:N-acetyltransferase [Thalassobacter stenotrophicus]PVZ48997.1 N-acetyltransferase [Thalassobacter stenotrophicus]CUH62023.1 putative acetyltransferase [Thalassobacter stenotrophicus]SHI36724.1 Predicted N-acetyltransferase YhbS [Thalassobacter stenotrophicus DSM 16310]
MELRQETPEDRWEVEALFDLCFAPGRTALSSYRLREDVAPVGALSLVAVDDLNIIGGAIRYWPVMIGDHEALLLGPVAVHPTRQGEGLGAFLIQDSLERAWALGHARVLLVGDAAYYRRLGFSVLTGVEMPPPTNPDRVLGVGDWAGVTGIVSRHP